MSHQSAGFARCISPARPRERGLKPERGAGSAGRGCAQRGRLDQLLDALDDELAACGIRGNLATRTSETQPDGTTSTRRSRSTRRRQDAPELPRRKMTARTTGQVYTTPDGKTYRPSMFLTLTCDSYGKVTGDGTPLDPAAYDYQRAARDAIHFPALFDRLIQNLRRYLGYEVQYFAAIEPQKRLAPHAHIAFRGAISRQDLRQVIAATYQVWWPATSIVRYGEGDDLPVWHEQSGNYLDPVTGELLPTWDQALDTTARRMSPGTSPGSDPSSTPRACSPEPKTALAASGTSPST